MNFRIKRILSFVVVGIYLFFGGVEYAVIFPTIWNYLQELGASEQDTYLLGLNLALYCVSASIAGIIGGRLADHFSTHIKLISVICLCAMVAGSLQYTLGISYWNVIMSRFVSGFGSGAGAVMMAEACRTTRPSERTAVLSIFNAARQIGILLSPAFQIVLHRFNFYIGSKHITSSNAPGVIMACLWSLLIILIVLFYFNLYEEYKMLRELEDEEEQEQEAAERRREISCGDIAGTASSQFWSTDIQACCLEHCIHKNSSHHTSSASHTSEESGRNYGTVTETARIITPQIQNLTGEPYHSTSHEEETAEDVFASERSGVKLSYYDTFMRDTTVALLSMAFAATFCEMSVETIVPPFMSDYFGYGEFQSSLVYMAVGLEGLMVYFIIAFLSKYVRDYTLNLGGWMLMIISHILYIVMVPSFRPGDTGHLSCYILSCSLMFLGYPIVTASNASLISKTLSEEAQGMGQGMRRLFNYIGFILGPLWGGAATFQPVLLFSVPLAVLVLHLILFADSFKNIRIIEDEIQPQLQNDGPRTEISEEREPLLRTRRVK